MTARHVLAIFTLVGMFVLSMQYPSYLRKDRAENWKRAFLRDYIKYLQNVEFHDQYGSVEKRDCIPLGGSGCAANNGKCCRKGDPYTGTLRNCVNVGGFSNPDYRCQE